MLNFQKVLLEDCLLDGVSFEEALHEISAQNVEEATDAFFTWRRWEREQELQGFYSF
jgi:hypothetical protein